MAKSLVSVPKKKERQDYIKGLIKGEMARFDKDNEEMALKAQISSKNFESKLDNVGMFRLKELYSVLDALDVKIIFARKQQPL